MEILYECDFNKSPTKWIGGFADYPAGEEYQYGLETGWRLLPAPLTGHGFELSGVNRSDDLFMYMKTELTGLLPNTHYSLAFRVTFATDASKSCVGTGGAPGESVVVKVGATQTEPMAMISNGSMQMNIDKGHQQNDGKDGLIIGNVANSNTDCNTRCYELKTLDSSDKPFGVTVGSDGRLWIYVGTDSGFESGTSLFYTNITVVSI